MPSLAQDQQFIKEIAPAAVSFYESHQFSAAVNIAQPCLESGYGTAAPGHNLYGIKADSSWKGHVVVEKTQEFYGGEYVTINAAFRAYPDFAASVEDHNQFFIDNPRYHNLFGLNYVQCANTIAAVDHYATDPTYGAQLLSIIRMFGLQKYDQLPPTHFVITVGYFSNGKQAGKAAARLLTVCGYHAIGIHRIVRGKKKHWVIQVGYFKSQDDAKQAQTKILNKLKYHSIAVEAVK